MSCPFSTSEVFEKVSCNSKIDDVIECPFINDCNYSPLWDAISDYIRKGIETYERAIKDDEDIVLETRANYCPNCGQSIKWK